MLPVPVVSAHVTVELRPFDRIVNVDFALVAEQRGSNDILSVRMVKYVGSLRFHPVVEERVTRSGRSPMIVDVDFLRDVSFEQIHVG